MRDFPRLLAGAALAAVLAMTITAPQAQQARQGARLAERWCMGCHVVEPEPPRAGQPGDRVPSFSAIAARPTTTPSSLALYLSTGHTNMPDFVLSGAERDALVAYILSLR
ncbi:MAG: cytochrome c [Reyranellaceae bacterium]